MVRWSARVAAVFAMGGVFAAAACSSDGASSPGTSSGQPNGGDDDGGITGDPDGTTTPPSGDGGSDGGQPTGSSKPNCKYQAHKTGLSSLTQAGGLKFSVYAPPSYDPNAGHSVVVIMHGQDSNGVPELTSLWQPIADAAGNALVLVAPQGSRPSTTGDPTVGNWASADLQNVLDIMTLVDDCYDVFPKKHILWGFSEGCFYGYLLGIGASDRFSGLAMGGANTSFARQSGYAPADCSWKIPVSHVHGTQDPNPIAQTYQDKTDFEAAGHVFTLHEHSGGHTISPAQVLSQYGDLATSVSP